MYPRVLVSTTKVGRGLPIRKPSCAYGSNDSNLTIPNSPECFISLLNLSVSMHSTIDASGSHLIPLPTLMHVQSVCSSTHFLTSTISTRVDDGVHIWDFDTMNWCVQVPWGLLKSFLMHIQAPEFKFIIYKSKKKLYPMHIAPAFVGSKRGHSR